MHPHREKAYELQRSTIKVARPNSSPSLFCTLNSLCCFIFVWSPAVQGSYKSDYSKRDRSFHKSELALSKVLYRPKWAHSGDSFTIKITTNFNPKNKVNLAKKTTQPRKAFLDHFYTSPSLRISMLDMQCHKSKIELRKNMIELRQRFCLILKYGGAGPGVPNISSSQAALTYLGENGWTNPIISNKYSSESQLETYYVYV